MPKGILINLEIALEIKAVIEGLDIFIVNPGGSENLLSHSKGHEQFFIEGMVVERGEASPELRGRIVGQPRRQDRLDFVLPILKEKIHLEAEGGPFVGIGGDDRDRNDTDSTMFFGAGCAFRTF